MKLKTVDLRNIKIEDAFWSKHVNLVKDSIIPYQWEAINDRLPDTEPSHSIANFEIAAGRKTGEYYGLVFQDTDVAKWLEAVGFSLAANPDPELEKTADEVIDLIAEAQQEDGYLVTYFIIKDPEQRWKNLCEGHELYSAGHMMEAAVAYYLATGKQKILDVMIKFADLIDRTFGPEEDKIHGYCGHQEIEIGLFKLYEVTGEKRYLNLAKYFIDTRGVGENYFIQEMSRPDFKSIWGTLAHNYQPEYSQSDRPVRDLMVATGHSVRAVYMYTAMADLADKFQDKSLMDACERLWNNIVNKQMYITGGIGSSGIMERFTIDYDLPNDSNYAESCASIGLAMFGSRMANITRDAAYVDTVELALYNTVLASIALDGKHFFYVNPLEVWPDNCMKRTSKEHVKPVRQKWFGCACCPPNIARTLASMGQYIYGVGEREVFINLFISNEAEIPLTESNVRMKMETRFPFENQVKIEVVDVPLEGMELAIRIPAYSKNYQITVAGAMGARETVAGAIDAEVNVTGAEVEATVAGATVEYRVEKGYAYVKVIKDTTIIISFEAPPRFVRANPNVRADCGKVAMVKGPLVYCFEEIDNGANLSALFVDAKQPIKEQKSELFGGITELVVQGKRMEEDSWATGELYGEYPIALKDVTLTAIPYPYWNNRGKSEMTVWIKELFHQCSK